MKVASPCSPALRKCSARRGCFQPVPIRAEGHRVFVTRAHIRKAKIMTKTLLFTVLTVTGSVMCASEADACGRGSCCAATTACAAPSCAAPAGGTAPADPHTGMNMSQTNRGSTYQSFSYEPGVTRPAGAAPMYSTPRPMMRQSAPSFYDTIRGDRKARGIYYPY